MLRRGGLGAALVALTLSACAVTPICPRHASWVAPATLAPVPDPVANPNGVVLLGEQHDRAEDHAWQLATIRRIAAARPIMLGFEMFPRRDQAVLDDWVAGRLDEAAFLRQSDWAHVWGFDAELYLPIFRFARDHRIPMVALNVSSAFVRQVARQGFAAVPVAEREGISPPAPPSPSYRQMLAEAMSDHGGAKMPPATLDRFIEAQLTWDRAMAEAIAHARAAHPDRTMVAIMGAGHLEHRDGVPHQLAALGVRDMLVLLPVHDVCIGETADLADALYVE